MLQDLTSDTNVYTIAFLRMYLDEYNATITIGNTDNQNTLTDYKIMAIHGIELDKMTLDTTKILIVWLQKNINSQKTDVLGQLIYQTHANNDILIDKEQPFVINHGTIDEINDTINDNGNIWISSIEQFYTQIVFFFLKLMLCYAHKKKKQREDKSKQTKQNKMKQAILQ